ncbi:MAG: DinB family protein [Dehalococcoidia bacterium]
MARAVLDHFVWQLDECFERKPEHSLMGNLSSVTSDVLDKLPPGGGRTMRDILTHCASVKRMHTNHAFGDGELTWWTVWDGDGEIQDASLESLMEWLCRCHAEAQEAVRSLADDDELLVERRTHWGELRSTRLIIDAVMIHDIYHAGEINHLRGLLQNADHFPHGGRT